MYVPRLPNRLPKATENLDMGSIGQVGLNWIFEKSNQTLDETATSPKKETTHEGASDAPSEFSIEETAKRNRSGDGTGTTAPGRREGAGTTANSR